MLKYKLKVAVYCRRTL